MIDLSLGGLIGAVVGTIVAGVNYAMVIGFVEKSLRTHDRSETPEERTTFESKLGIMRRTVLGLDLLLFGGLGYWIGDAISG
jgi:hypothetical protein